MKFGSGSYVESAIYSPCGEFIATGSADGIIELWDPETLKLKEALSYQLDENPGIYVEEL